MDPAEALGQAVADEVVRLKAAAGMSNRELARRMGKSHPYIGERLDHSKPFDLNDVTLLAEVFGLDPLELIDQAMRNVK